MNSFAFDSYAAFPFQFHAVKDLFNHFTLLKNTGFFKDPVCESAFAMVDMCHNTEIADMIHIIVHEHLRKDVLYVRACFHFRESAGQYWHGALRCT